MRKLWVLSSFKDLSTQWLKANHTLIVYNTLLLGLPAITYCDTNNPVQTITWQERAGLRTGQPTLN